MVSGLESLYERWNAGRCDEVLEQLPQLDDQQPTVQIVEWQELLQEAGLSGVVEQMLAALQRDGCVVLSDAVPTDVCDAIEAEIAPYKWRSRSDGRTEGITGSLLSRSRFVQHMAAHPAVIAFRLSVEKGPIRQKPVADGCTWCSQRSSVPGAHHVHGR